MKKYLILLSVIFSVINSNSQKAVKVAPVNPDRIRYEEELKAGKLPKDNKDGHKFGYIPSPAKPKFSKLKDNNLQAIENLPSYYDLRSTGMVTAVKNQGNCGSCWAFAACASLESSWKQKGLGDYNISENNLKNCHGFYWGGCDGGNITIATSYLTRFSGPVSETDDPYIAIAESCKPSINSLALAYVSDARFLEPDINIIKQSLIKNGAIYTAYYHNNIYYRAYDFTYYYNGTSAANHAVTIVGWDDNKLTAGGKGAWIIKNSWGETWGEKGYFYISFNDTRVLSENAYFPERIENKPGTKVYCYDKLGWINDIGYGNNTAYGLIRFDVTENNSLSRIGTWINTSGTIVDIEVYDNFNGSVLSNLKGTLYNQTCTEPGYYTFNLATPVAVTQGDDIYIKIKYYTPGYNFPIPVEAYYKGYAEPQIETSKCWVSSGGNSTWLSIGAGTSFPYDLCVKAYASGESVCIVPVIINNPADLTVCEYGNATFSVSASGSSVLSYKWYRNETELGTYSNVIYINSVKKSDAGIYSCVISNSCGTITSNSAMLKVNSISTGPTGISISADNVCRNTAISLIPVGGIKGTGASYKWYGEPECKNLLYTGDVYTVSPLVSTTYWVRLEGECNITSSVSASVSILPDVSIISQPSDLTVYSGQNATFSVLAEGSNLSYQWLQNGYPISDNQNYSGTRSNKLIISNTEGLNGNSYNCNVSGDCGKVISDKATLSVISSCSPAVITSQPSSYQTCAGNSFVVKVTVSGTAPFVYQWRKDNIDIIGATNSELSVNNAQLGDAGSYACFITNCNGNFGILSNAALISISPSPLPTVTPPGPVYIKSGRYVTLKCKNNRKSSYQWYKNGIMLAGAVNYYYNAGATGTYYIKETDINGCYGISNSVVVTVSGKNRIITDDSLSSEINVYPNPFNDFARIEYDLSETTEVNIKVFDMVGREMQTIENTVKNKGKHTAYFYPNDIPEGVYMLGIIFRSGNTFLRTDKLLIYSK